MRRAVWWLAVIGLVLICLRLALPFAVENYVNHQLRKSHHYTGRIGKVTIHLWRGAYQIHDIHIFKTNGRMPVPFFFSRVLDLSLQWSELLHGALVSKIIMQQPGLNFVSGPAEAQTQTGIGDNWGDILESLVPFKINRLDIVQGQIHFLNPYSTPPVDIYVDEVAAVATNFANSYTMTGDLPAGVIARGETLGGGGVYLAVQVDPLAKTPTFELTSQLTNVDLVALNDFLRAYGKFDVARGTFDLFSSFATTNNTYNGYCKVFFRDLKVFNWEQDKKKDALEIFWKAIVGTLTTAFKNQPHDQLATKIPITGSLGKTDVHVWPTIATLLRNAFIQALVPKPDEPVKVKAVDANASRPAVSHFTQPTGTAKR